MNEVVTPHLQEMAPGFHMLDVLDRGLPQYAAGWVVEGRRSYALVEVGTGAAIPLWLNALHAAGIAPERVEWILVTHVHLDHAGAAGALLKHLPNARIGVHPRGIRHLADPTRLLEAARAAWGSDFDLLGPMEPAPADRIVGLQDGAEVDLDGLRRFRVLHTPGHAPHHVCYFEETSRGVFPGDALGGIYPEGGPFGEAWHMPGIAPPMGDLPMFIRSVRRIKELAPQRLYATHFGLKEDARPYLDAAAGQIALLWELCEEVSRNGGTLTDAQERVIATALRARTTDVGNEELRKDYRLITEAAWNYVTQR